MLAVLSQIRDLDLTMDHAHRLRKSPRAPEVGTSYSWPLMDDINQFLEQMHLQKGSLRTALPSRHISEEVITKKAPKSTGIHKATWSDGLQSKDKKKSLFQYSAHVQVDVSHKLQEMSGSEERYQRWIL